MSTSSDTDSEVSSTYNSEGEIQCCLTKSDNSSDYDALENSQELDHDLPLPVAFDAEQQNVKSSGSSHTKELDPAADFPLPVFAAEEKQEFVSIIRSEKKGAGWIFPRNIGRHIEEEHSSIYRQLDAIQDQNHPLTFVSAKKENLFADKTVKPVPSVIHFNAFVFYQNQPMLVLTFARDETRSVIEYNFNIAKQVQIHVTNDLQGDFTCIHGVVEEKHLQNHGLFLKTISDLKKNAKAFAVASSLHMDQNKCKEVIQSFLKLILRTSRQIDANVTVEKTYGSDVVPSDSMEDSDHSTDCEASSCDKVQEPEEIRIAIIGQTGSGKSSTGNTIAGWKAFKTGLIGEPSTEMSDFITFTHNGKNIIVFDVPVFSDSQRSFHGLKNATTDCFIDSCPGIHVLLLTIPIRRYTSNDINTIIQLEGYGKEAKKNVIVVFTRKDDLDYENISLDQYIASLPNNFKIFFGDINKRFILVNDRGPAEEMSTLVANLMGMIYEMMRQNGGDCYTNEIHQLAKQKMKLAKEKTWLAKEMSDDEEMAQSTSTSLARKSQRTKEEERMRKEETKKKLYGIEKFLWMFGIICVGVICFSTLACVLFCKLNGMSDEMMRQNGGDCETSEIHQRAEKRMNLAEEKKCLPEEMRNEEEMAQSIISILLARKSQLTKKEAKNITFIIGMMCLVLFCFSTLAFVLFCKLNRISYELEICSKE